MIAALTPKPQLVTRRLGNLAAIQNPAVHTVIWSRTLPRENAKEIAVTVAASRSPVDFFSLTNDPFDRIQHQLRKAGIGSHFLACDIALLVTVFGEITHTSRVRAQLGTGPGSGAPASAEYHLVAAYGYPRKTFLRFTSYVALFRGSWSQDHPLANPASGLRLSLDPAPDTTPR